MRKIYLFLLMAIPLFFASCSDDDEKDDEQYNHYKTEILGTWKTLSFDYELELMNDNPQIKPQLEQLVKQLIDDALEGEEYSSELWTFHEDYSFAIENRYTGEFATGSYQLKNNRLRISVEGETTDWSEIIGLTYDKLQIGSDLTKEVNKVIQLNKKEIIDQLMYNGLSQTQAAEAFKSIYIDYLAVFMVYERVG